MRFREFVKEDAFPLGKNAAPNKGHNSAQPGAIRFTDDGVDRFYTLNKAMAAAGMSDGSSTKPLKGIDGQSFAGKYNMAYPFTELEHKMCQQAFNSVQPVRAEEVIRDHKSHEPQDTNKTSPVQGFAGYGKKKKR